MKRLKFLVVCLVCMNIHTFSCNLSSLDFISVTGSGPYVTTVRLCVGYGITGVTIGADSETRTIAFGLYKAGGLTLSAFTPASITSARGFNNCTMNGTSIGPQGPPFNSDQTIIYVDPGYYGSAPCVTQPYACVTSTALCGNVGQDCKIFTFTTNVCPDSIVAFGVEGAGNPIGGCYPNPDMRTNVCYSALPLHWDDISAEFVNNNTAVKINWSTFSEINNDYFTVQRTTDHHATTFDEIGTVPGTNTTIHKNYSLVDEEPAEGVSLYRVKQIDYDGATTHTRFIPVHFYPNAPIELKIYPNPAWDIFTIEAQNLIRISVYSAFGQLLYDYNDPVNGINIIDTAPFRSGLYLLKLTETNGNITTHKIEVHH